MARVKDKYGLQLFFFFFSFKDISSEVVIYSSMGSFYTPSIPTATNCVCVHVGYSVYMSIHPSVCLSDICLASKGF